MLDSPAIRLFRKNWFLREVQTPEITQVVIGMRGCGGAVSFLLDRGVSLDVDPVAYNVLHEAAWAGSADTLEAVFASGAADATSVSVEKPHTGWPANLSLMYWAAWGGFPDVARLLIAYGVGKHHELPIKGNGERGETSLHEAAAPGHWGDDDWLRNQGKREVARMLIEDGAVYDACAAAALNDTSRLETLLTSDLNTARSTGAYGMTLLHWASRADSLACVKLLLKRGADVDALLDAGADRTMLNKNGKTAFEIARLGASYFKKRI